MRGPEPTVTAVIPTRRRPELLRRAIESVLAQTWTKLRVFVSDNASGDTTEQAVRQIAARDPRVIYHGHPVDIGAYPNFQFGLDAVGTEMFSFLSDDDLLFPDFYRRAVDALSREPDAGFYASQVVLYDVARGTHRLRPEKHWRAGRHEAGESARLMAEQHFIWTGCVFRSSVRGALGAIAPVPMGDILFTAKAAAAFPFVADLRPGAVFSEADANYSQMLPVETLRRSSQVARDWAAGIAGLSDADREGMVGIVDARSRDVAHRILRDATEAEAFERFLEVADYLEERGDLSPSRRAKIAFGRPGGWRFRALSTWSRLQSGYKRRRRSGWKTRTVEEIIAAYS